MRSKNIKAKAMQIGVKNFNMQSMRLGRFERMNFEQFLDYLLKQKKALKFIDFNKNCGISRKQWDLFRTENKDKDKIEWIVG